MKKKILIGSIFAVLIMLSMPVISNIQAQPAPATIPAEETDGCSICPLGLHDGWCDFLRLEKENYEAGLYYYEEGEGCDDPLAKLWIPLIRGMIEFTSTLIAISLCK